MTAHNTLRLCHTGMDSRSLYAFELFLSRISPHACQISGEESADVAFIDLDNELGAYLLEGHRLLYPSRPLIVSARRPPMGNDPLTIEVVKPVGLSAFSAALEQVRRLLPGDATTAPAAPAEPARTATPPALDSRQPSADPISLLRQIEERLSTFYVGSMPDVDLDDLAARSAIYYTPEHFLQGVIARAIAHAREIQRPVRIDDPNGAALYLDPRSGIAYQARSANALRALAQLPTRGTVSLSRVESSDAPALESLAGRSLEALEWDVALWASRGRVPVGTHLDHPVRLLAWPNLTRLAVPPEAMRIAGLWSKGGISLRDTVRLLGVPQRYVFAFYSACLALGHVEQLSSPGAVAVARHNALAVGTVEAGAPPMRGLFKRILGKLLGARVGEAAAG
ncbi:hypothetical protein [Thauera aminoaromatica]|uniref:Uncharacterized protein n=1 Tax=Thauera aminoaromatica TaxID=164330 RepID=A0A5C7SGJ1_THASP|nr:hypothetical protein [Thauera aminoaromatica]TXH82633.1 MAG: hypothetical protein E6Q80_15065 [Thauera aminoaromatica]